MSAWLALMRWDIHLQLRARAEWAVLMLFFFIVIVLLPFSVGPDSALLARLAPGLLWLGVVLMVLLSLSRLYEQDAEDGTLDAMRLCPLPLPLVIASKLFAQCAAVLAALLVSLLPAAVMLSLPVGAWLPLLFSFLLGVPCLIFLGGILSALTATQHRSPAQLTLLLAPFYVPVLIFGIGASDMVTSDAQRTACLLFLGAFLALLLPAAPCIIAAILHPRGPHPSTDNA